MPRMGRPRKIVDENGEAQCRVCKVLKDKTQFGASMKRHNYICKTCNNTTCRRQRNVKNVIRKNIEYSMRKHFGVTSDIRKRVHRGLINKSNSWWTGLKEHIEIVYGSESVCRGIDRVPREGEAGFRVARSVHRDQKLHYVLKDIKVPPRFVENTEDGFNVDCNVVPVTAVEVKTWMRNRIDCKPIDPMTLAIIKDAEEKYYKCEVDRPGAMLVSAQHDPWKPPSVSSDEEGDGCGDV